MSRSALLQIPQNMQCRNNMQCREGQPGENMQQKESMGKTHCWELSRPAVGVIMEPTNTTSIFFIIAILQMIIMIKSMVLAVWRCKLKWCSMLQSNWIHCIYKIKPALSISHPHHKSSFIVDIITNIIVIIITRQKPANGRQHLWCGMVGPGSSLGVYILGCSRLSLLLLVNHLLLFGDHGGFKLSDPVI